MAGGKADQLLTLSRVRAKASVPVAGNYRLIDFALSNCAHSAISHVAVLTQYLPVSLKAHIGVGRPWDLDRRAGGVKLLEPYYAGGEHHWYAGTADALAQNLEIIDDNRFDHVIVVSGDHVYKMDYRPLLDFHRVARADITMVVKAIPPERACRCGVVQLGRGNIVVNFQEKPPQPKSPYASLAIYVFDRRFLVAKLKELAAAGGSDIVFDLLAPLIPAANVYAYLFYDYWAKIDNVDDYYDVSFDLARDGAPLLMDDPVWPVFTTQHDDPPVKIGPEAAVTDSMVADGCIINGRVENSILFRRVYVEAGATIRDSILMEGTRADAGAQVNRAILDKNVHVGSRAVVGADDDEAPPNSHFPEQLARGITLVGKGSQIPPDMTVGRNCLIDIGITANALSSSYGRELPSGATALGNV